MRCRKARALLPLYVGRDLPTRLEKRLRGHLQECPVCGEEKAAIEAALLRIREEAAREKEFDWQPAAWANLMDRIGQEKHPRRLLFSPRWRWALACGLAFCLLALAWAGIFGGRFLRFGKIPSPPIEKAALREEMKPSAPLEGALPTASTPEEPLWASLPDPREKISLAPMPSDLPETITVSLMSQETGLQLIWVFNKEFDWKGVIQ